MKIYQVYYNEISKKNLDKKFIPYDNSKPLNDKEFEYGVMRNIYLNNNPFKNDKLFGVLSWKFQEKSTIKSKDLTSWINKNKGYDAYICNPWPELSYIFYNLWYQGEYWHPGLIELAEYLFKKANIDIDIRKIRTDSNTCCFCNYWIANQKFWKVYIDTCEKLYKAIYSCDDNIKNLLFNTNVYGDKDVAFFPFIFERMFSTILSVGKFKTISFDTLTYKKVNIFKDKFFNAAYMFGNKNSYNSNDIEVFNSFGHAYNDMTVGKFKNYDNYLCGDFIH